MTQFAWLIEAPGPRYLRARKISTSYDFHWSSDPSSDKTLRFCSELQADFTMMALREMNPELFAFGATLGDAKVVEHGWLETPPETVAERERKDRQAEIRDNWDEQNGPKPTFRD